MEDSAASITRFPSASITPASAASRQKPVGMGRSMAIANASRPPLYHGLLQLPKTLRELETKLGVDAVADFREGKLARAGFIQHA